MTTTESDADLVSKFHDAIHGGREDIAQQLYQTLRIRVLDDGLDYVFRHNLVARSMFQGFDAAEEYYRAILAGLDAVYCRHRFGIQS